MNWTTFIQEKKPVFKEEVKRVFFITIGASIFVTIVQVIVAFDRISDLRLLISKILIILIMSFSISSSATFTSSYSTRRITKKLSFVLRLIISFLALIFSLIFGIYQGQFAVWLLGLVDDPYFLGRNGFWLSFAFSNFVAIVVTVYYGLKEKLEIAYKKIRIQERQKSELELLKAKAELEDKLADLRQKLMGSLTDQFDREMRRGTQRIEDTVAPFARFVRAEQDKIGAQRDQLVELEAHIVGLRAQLRAGEPN